MKGYNLFIEKFNRLSEREQNKLLTRIFGVSVFLFDINDYNEKIIVKLYDKKKFYQFVFNFCSSDICLDIIIKDRIVLCNIFIFNPVFGEGIIVNNDFCKFINILKNVDISYFDIL